MGDRERRLIPALHHVGQGGGGNNLATTRESTRDSAMSNPHKGDARS
jgi:hypothetical protein